MSELGLKSQVIVEIGFEWMKKLYGTHSEWLSQILIKSIAFNSIIIRNSMWDDIENNWNGKLQSMFPRRQQQQQR